MKNSKLVTFLVPAISEKFAKQSVLSLMAQTCANFEIFLSDNTADGLVFNSPEINALALQNQNINLRHAYPETKGDMSAHHLSLLKFGTGDYFKFMFDDDLLAPLSTDHLLKIIDKENVVAAYHGRYNFNDLDFDLSSPQSLEFNGALHRKLSLWDISSLLFSYCINIFSEPSFGLYKSDVKNIIYSKIELGGMKIRYLGDVVLPLMICEKYGHVAVSMAKLGFFRRHGLQDSSLGSAVRLSGLVEWELIGRYLNQRNHFNPQQIMQHKNRIREIYNKGKSQFPFLADRFYRVIAKDEKYMLNEEFREFYSDCRKSQNLD